MPDEPLTWTNRMAIAKFNRTRGVPKDGAQLILPDIGQVHTVVGVMHWRYRDRFPITNQSIIFEAPCAVCGALYRYNLPWRLQDRLVRTCPDHRGQWRTPVPRPRTRWKVRPFEQRISRLLLSTVSKRIQCAPSDAVVSLADELHKPGQRLDAVRYRIRRHLQCLIAEGRLPKGVRVNAQGDFFYDP